MAALKCAFAPLTAHPAVQVSEAGLGALLQLASGDPSARARRAPDGTLQLSVEAMAAVRTRAYAEVTLPSEIIDLLTELRTYLQQECEPPVYVSGAHIPPTPPCGVSRARRNSGSALVKR